MKISSIGGQGVLEGVMMRSPTCTGIAVRRESGEMAVQKTKNKPATERNVFFRIPVIRGFLSFIEMLYLGVKTITDAVRLYDEELAEEELKPNKAEEFVAKKTGKDVMDVTMFFAVVIALVLAVVLFFVVPNVLTGFLEPYIANDFLKNLTEGLIRLAIFFIYMSCITLMPDIKRLFSYHGAEHKVINCYEHDMPMDVENAQKFTTRHPRCGTSYLLIVMIISILVFALFGWQDNPLARVGVRIALLPVVSGVAYEVLKLVAKYENGFTRALRKPGMALQAMTTREPDDTMVEAALLAFFIAEDEHTDEEIEAKRIAFSRMNPEDNTSDGSGEDE
ncbi:MAG: DUF1385 domain-containing protein [Christensenellaceae bacterium]|nr:DUF1385 domain-containing protein [Christensenellaceae bacterium]